MRRQDWVAPGREPLKIRSFLGANTLPGAADFKKFTVSGAALGRTCAGILHVERPGDVSRGPPRRPRLARSGGLDRCSKLMDSLPCYRLVRMVPRIPC